MNVLLKIKKVTLSSSNYLRNIWIAIPKVLKIFRYTLQKFYSDDFTQAVTDS